MSLYLISPLSRVLLLSEAVHTRWNSLVVEFFPAARSYDSTRRNTNIHAPPRSDLCGQCTCQAGSDSQARTRPPAPESIVRLIAVPDHDMCGLDSRNPTTADLRCIGTRPFLIHYQPAICYAHYTVLHRSLQIFLLLTLLRLNFLLLVSNSNFLK